MAVSPTHTVDTRTSRPGLPSFQSYHRPQDSRLPATPQAASSRMLLNRSDSEIAQALSTSDTYDYHVRTLQYPPRPPTPPTMNDPVVQSKNKRRRSAYEDEGDGGEEDISVVTTLHETVTLHAYSNLKRRRTASLDIEADLRPLPLDFAPRQEHWTAFNPSLGRTTTLADHVHPHASLYHGVLTPASSPIDHDPNASDPMVVDIDSDVATPLCPTHPNAPSAHHRPASIASLAPQWRIVHPREAWRDGGTRNT